MARYMLVRHKVRDYATWRSGYDAHVPKRIEAGLQELHLFRSADDPNEIVILFEALDLGHARTFAESADLKATMQEVGVIDAPDIWFLED